MKFSKPTRSLFNKFSFLHPLHSVAIVLVLSSVFLVERLLCSVGPTDQSENFPGPGMSTYVSHRHRAFESGDSNAEKGGE